MAETMGPPPVGSPPPGGGVRPAANKLRLNLCLVTTSGCCSVYLESGRRNAGFGSNRRLRRAGSSAGRIAHLPPPCGGAAYTPHYGSSRNG